MLLSATFMSATSATAVTFVSIVVDVLLPMFWSAVSLPTVAVLKRCVPSGTNEATVAVMTIVCAPPATSVGNVTEPEYAPWPLPSIEYCGLTKSALGLSGSLTITFRASDSPPLLTTSV